MIGTAEVIRALSGLVEAVFGAPPVTKDIREGFARPCTYLTPTDSRTERMGGLLHTTTELELVRFGAKSWKGWRELLRAQDALTAALLEPVEAEESFHLLAEDTDFDLVREDMALYCTFSVQYFQDRPEPGGSGGGEPMEHLQVTMEETAGLADGAGTPLSDELDKQLEEEGHTILFIEE